MLNKRSTIFTALFTLSILIFFSPVALHAQTPPDAPLTAQQQKYRQAVQLHNQGVKLVQEQDYVAALQKFKEAIALCPDFAEAHCNYGNMLMHAGQVEQALPEFQRAVEIKPDLQVAWEDLGTCNQSLGKTVEAVQAYKKYLELDQNGARAEKVKSALALLQSELERTAAHPIIDDPHDYLGEATQNGMTRWSSNLMPLKIYIKPGGAVPSYRPAFETILKQAFQDWSEASNKLVSFVYVNHERGANIVCFWTNNPKEMMSSAEGGHAMVIPDEHNIARAKIILLTVSPNNGQITDRFSRRVYLHEIGHALGLLGHSKNPHDIMFSSLPAADYDCALSERDKNTLIALYKADASQMTSRPLDISHLMMSGDPSTIVVRVIKLNAEAAEAMKNQKFALAVLKLEEALKLDPDNDLIIGNLGAAYGNCASVECLLRDFTRAELYFKQALPLLQKGTNKANYLIVLKNYDNMLQLTKHYKEADQISKQVKTLESNN